MKEDKKIFFTEIAKRLDKAINAKVGVKGLEILVAGMVRKKLLKRSTLSTRKRIDGEFWLTAKEINRLSRYAGYDFTQND